MLVFDLFGVVDDSKVLSHQNICSISSKVMRVVGLFVFAKVD